MDPSYDPHFFAQYLSGQATEMKPMVNLMAQVFAILVTGIVLWRISAVFSKKTRKRRQNIFSESRFQNWKNNH